MKTNIRKAILFVGLLICSQAFAQLNLRSFDSNPTDLTAAVNQRLDLNEEPCALIIVHLPVEGVKFSGNIVGDPIYNVNEYWVYMTEGSRKIRIQCPGFETLLVDLIDDNGKNGVESKMTYNLRIDGYQKSSEGITAIGAAGDEKLATNIKTKSSIAEDSNSQQPQSKTFSVNGISFELAYVKGAKYKMGWKKSNYSYEKNEQPVTVSDFYLGTTEVTRELWDAVMGTNTSDNLGGNYPVTDITYEDCFTFINNLNQLTGQKFRLPTESEWEFAARGGCETKGTIYSGNNKCNPVAWCFINAQREIHPVAQKEPNELGIFDMSGNVEEWTDGKINDNFTTNNKGSYAVCRGVHILTPEKDLYLYRRSCTPISQKSPRRGLRIAL